MISALQAISNYQAVRTVSTRATIEQKMAAATDATGSILDGSCLDQNKIGVAATAVPEAATDNGMKGMTKLPIFSATKRVAHASLHSWHLEQTQGHERQHTRQPGSCTNAAIAASLH